MRGSWPSPSDLSHPMASPLRLSHPTTFAFSLCSLSPLLQGWYFLKLTPREPRTRGGTLSNRHLFIPHWEVQLATMMEQSKLLAEEAVDEVGACVLPLHEANQCSAQRCP